MSAGVAIALHGLHRDPVSHNPMRNQLLDGASFVLALLCMCWAILGHATLDDTWDYRYQRRR
jgi:hypothetical protein